MGKYGRYTFTMLHAFASDDATLTTAIVNIAWVHGIYGTHEESTVTVIITAADGDFVIDRTGCRQDLILDPFPELVQFLESELQAEIDDDK